MRNYSALLVLVLMAALTVPAVAQQRSSAGIYGSVSDSQGAVIPGAKVTVLHVSTNQARTTVTNLTGEYLFPLLPVGEYRISVEQPGFKRYEQTGLVLQVNDNAKVDVVLEVGEASTTVTVEGAVVSVETANATIKEVIDARRVVDLPLNGRNLADLTLLVAGVQPVGGANADSGLGAYSSPGSKYLSVNGSRQNQLKYTLDGGDNSDNLFNTNLAFPFPDAVQEFSMVTSNSGLELGRSSAGSVNIVTKSGTNTVHGNAFWFVRNTAMNANGFFSRFPDGLKRNQTGATLGGPIIKNKLFLFGGYQRNWIRTISGGGQARTMPAAFRSGDFSSLLPGTVIKDPTNGQPFNNNMIPQARQSPAAQALLKFSPLPDPDGFTRYSLSQLEDASDYIVRGDYRLSTRHSFLGRFFQENYTLVTPFVPNNIHSTRRGLDAPTTSATLGYTFVASPTLISDTHISMAREVGNRTVPFPKTIADFGVKVYPASNEINVSINGTSGLSLSTGFRPAVFARTNVEGTHSWQWIHGRHSFTWGGEVATLRYNEYNVFNASGVYQFNGRNSGFDQADYILGAMSLFRQGNGEIEFRRRHYLGFYGGDTFRATSRLTFNFGVRWEPYLGVTDLNDREDQFIQEWYVKGAKSPHFVNAPPGLFYPGDKLPDGYVIPKAGTEGSKWNISPRFGFAWDVMGDGKTSVRAGFGVFFDQPEMWLLNNMNDAPPFSFSLQFLNGQFDDPYAGRQNLNVFPFAGDFDPKSPFALPVLIDSLQHRFLLSYTQNWNLTVERKLAADWLLRVGYVGTKSTHLKIGYDQNAPIYDFSKTLSQNQSTIDDRRPRHEYENIYTMMNGLGQNYNSLQLSLNKRFNRGFSVLGSYTFSKNIDYSSSNNNTEDSTLVNPFNFGYTRGLADNDHTHRFVGSFVWDLPDPGKQTGSKLLSAILGGWQASGIVTVQSGRVFSIYSSGDRTAGAAGGPGGDALADLTGNLTVTGGSRGAQIAKYFDTSAVSQARAGTYGTLGRNVLRGPRYSNTDLSIARAFPLSFREGLRLLFRSEFFNLFNHPNLGRPAGTIGNSDFGRITSTDGDPRILQISLKVEF
jgi:hypothetical protein